MTRMPSSRLPLPALLVALAGITALYWDAVRTPFLNDDFMFLEEARSRTLAASLTELGPLGNYYRPVSRQIYFKLLSPLANGSPLAFHLVNNVLFLVALVLVADLLAALLPRAGVLAGTLYFALLPFQRVNLMWVSCSQDLLALTGVLGALALWRRDRRLPALACFGVACMSKETALAFPIGLVAWERAVRGRAWAAIVRRVLPFAAVAAAWAAVAITMRARHAAAVRLDLAPGAFAAALVHMGQSLLGLDFPAGLGPALVSNGPAIAPLVAFVALAAWYAPARPTPGVPGAAVASAPPARRSGLVVFAALWAIAFALPAGPVSYGWSSYYYTLAAVGAAVVFGMLFARGDRWTWMAITSGLLWWHAANTATPARGPGFEGPAQAFAVREDPWTWTSHLTAYYFKRAAALTQSISRELDRVVPHPAPHTRLFFATLPPWAGFQMGNGAQVRALYRDSTLASYFYSQFSDSTANAWPCRFLFWDGRRLVPLYANARDPWFQVGSDLLLLDRPAGARHAFMRGLRAGEDRMDHLYWLGWAELMLGRRDRAEAVWTAFGALDDSLKWSAHLRAAHNAITDRDTVEARRHLITAVEYGIGRPQAHAVLGELMLADPKPYDHKYGLMELKVAAWLNPRDWEARRSLALGLAEVRLDAQAERELEALMRGFPELAGDTAVARVWSRYAKRDPTVVDMKGGR